MDKFMSEKIIQDFVDVYIYYLVPKSLYRIWEMYITRSAKLR